MLAPLYEPRHRLADMLNVSGVTDERGSIGSKKQIRHWVDNGAFEFDADAYRSGREWRQFSDRDCLLIASAVRLMDIGCPFAHSRRAASEMFGRPPLARRGIRSLPDLVGFLDGRFWVHWRHHEDGSWCYDFSDPAQGAAGLLALMNEPRAYVVINAGIMAVQIADKLGEIDAA